MEYRFVVAAEPVDFVALQEVEAPLSVVLLGVTVLERVLSAETEGKLVTVATTEAG